MHFVPFGSYQAHYIGQTGFRVPQPATLSHPAGDKKQQIPGEPPKSKGVLYQASGVQKVRHARPLTSKAWSDEEDKKLVDLRRKGLAWTAISRELPGRTYLACRLRFGNHLSPLDKWPGNCQSHVAGYYNRYLVQTQNEIPQYSILRCLIGKVQWCMSRQRVHGEQQRSIPGGW